MHLSDPISFTGNLVALVGLAWKTGYDLWWNPKRFQRETDRLGATDVAKTMEAAKRKRERSDNTTLILFAVLFMSYLIFFLGEFK